MRGYWEWAYVRDMSEGVVSGEVVDRDAILRAAVDEHRRALEALAAGTARVGEIDREIERLQTQRVDALREVEKLHADLTSGRAAGEAIAALGLGGLSGVGRGAKPARRQPKRGAARVNSRKQGRSNDRVNASGSAGSTSAGGTSTASDVEAIGA